MFKRKRNKKHHKILRIFFILILMAFIVLLYLFKNVYNNINNTVNKMNDTNFHEERKISNLLKNRKPFNMLLLGTDTGDLGRDDRGRTDTIIIATVNPQKREVLLTSIARDTMVAIPGYQDKGFQKINAAYEFGSVKGAARTVSEYLNVPIDAYALVNMGGLIKMIDQVGGVKVVSPLSFTFSQDTSHQTGKDMYRFTKGQSDYEWSNNYGKTWVKKSVMNGDAALAFSRMRYTDPIGDYGRQLRQRLVLKALLKKSVNYHTLINNQFLNSLSNNVKTNLNLKDFIIIMTQYKVVSNNVSTLYLHAKTKTFNGQDFQVSTKSDKQKVTDKIRSALGLGFAPTGNKYGGTLTDALEEQIQSSEEQINNDDNVTNSANTYADKYNDNSHSGITLPSSQSSSSLSLNSNQDNNTLITNDVIPATEN